MRELGESFATSVTVSIDGEQVQVARGTILAAVLLNLGLPCRISESGEPRTALCGMGICFECRVHVDGEPYQRACQIVCREGMRVVTQ
jgi:sarcosine oxidase subunit alpha